MRDLAPQGQRSTLLGRLRSSSPGDERRGGPSTETGRRLVGRLGVRSFSATRLRHAVSGRATTLSSGLALVLRRPPSSSSPSPPTATAATRPGSTTAASGSRATPTATTGGSTSRSVRSTVDSSPSSAPTSTSSRTARRCSASTAERRARPDRPGDGPASRRRGGRHRRQPDVRRARRHDRRHRPRRRLDVGRGRRPEPRAGLGRRPRPRVDAAAQGRRICRPVGHQRRGCRGRLGRRRHPDPARERQRRLPRPRDHLAAEDVGDASRVTTVGETPVVLDAEAGRAGDPRWRRTQAERSDVPSRACCSSPALRRRRARWPPLTPCCRSRSPAASPTVLADGVGGRPARRSASARAQYGAWSGGGGAVVTACDGASRASSASARRSSDLVFRVNRGEILLNDRATGAVWNIDSEQPTRLDDWDAFKRKATEEDEKEENEDEHLGDRRPPVAKPDALGARPGRTTVLHPLDNDTAPRGRLLSIRSVEQVTGSGSTVTISPDGQTVQIPAARRDGRVSFDYFIDDGREGKPPTRRSPCRSAQPTRSTARPSCGWASSRGCGPCRRAARSTSRCCPTGATSRTATRSSSCRPRPRRWRPQRRRRPAHGERPDPVHGPGGRLVTDRLHRHRRHRRRGRATSSRFQVQDPKDRQAFPGVAEPDVVAARSASRSRSARSTTTCPGSDPLTPDAPARSWPAGSPSRAAPRRRPTWSKARSPSAPAWPKRTSSTTTRSTATRRSPRARSGSTCAPRSGRRTSRSRCRTPPSSGQAATLVDVLANDVDPTGGLLVVQGARPTDANQLDVAVVDGRWLRISARQGLLPPNPQIVRYAISNGTRSGIEGEVVVTQRPSPRTTPRSPRPTGSRSAPAELSRSPCSTTTSAPSGDQLTLVGHVADETAGRARRSSPRATRRSRPGRRSWPGASCATSPRADLDDAQTFTVRYLGRNAAGETAPGTIEVTVVPADRANQPPEPPALEGRAVAGDTVKLKVPGAGVDPDGDPVTLTRHRLGAQARPDRPDRGQLALLPGLPGQRRHRRVQLHRHRLRSEARPPARSGSRSSRRARRSRRSPSPTPSPSSRAAPPRSTSSPTTTSRPATG